MKIENCFGCRFKINWIVCEQVIATAAALPTNRFYQMNVAVALKENWQQQKKRAKEIESKRKGKKKIRRRRMRRRKQYVNVEYSVCSVSVFSQFKRNEGKYGAVEMPTADQREINKQRAIWIARYENDSKHFSNWWAARLFTVYQFGALNLLNKLTYATATTTTTKNWTYNIMNNKNMCEWAETGWAMNKWEKTRWKRKPDFYIQVPMCSCIVCKFSIKRYLIFDIIKQESNMYDGKSSILRWEGSTLTKMINSRFVRRKRWKRWKKLY